MNRTLLTLATASFLALGCGRAALEPAAQSAAPPAAAKADAKPAEEAAKAPEAKAAEGDKAPASELAPGARKVGDYVIHRFSGSFRKTPLTLTQRVIARQGATLTISILAEEGDKKQEYRVKVDESAGQSNVVGVALVENGAEKPATIEAYEALMARTALAADENEGLVAAEDVRLSVGGAQLACKRTSYRVRVGKHRATLRTIESASFAWGDVGGEITAANGKVLYKAEVIEAGHDGAPKGAAVAHSDIEE
jgi:hypothetical protein